MQIHDRSAWGVAAMTLMIAFSSPVGCADHIGRADLLQRIAAGTPPVIIDVRSRGEFEAGHVPGAVHVPFYSLLGRIDELPESREPGDPVVVYCEHGPRAGIARAELWMASDRPVLFLDGHMTAWRSEGLPMEVDGSATEAPGDDD